MIKLSRKFLTFIFRRIDVQFKTNGGRGKGYVFLHPGRYGQSNCHRLHRRLFESAGHLDEKYEKSQNEIHVKSRHGLNCHALKAVYYIRKQLALCTKYIKINFNYFIPRVFSQKMNVGQQAGYKMVQKGLLIFIYILLKRNCSV